MDDQQWFGKNLERLKYFCPEVAPQLESVDCSHLQFCFTKAGELNLRTVDGAREVFYYSQDGAVEEAKKWFESVFPVDVKVLCIFGIGLGYYYDALFAWLHGHPENYLVFIEDDLAVLRRFLESGERAHAILNDTQVNIQYFQTPITNWKNFRKQFGWFWRAFGYSKVRISALNYYREGRSILYKQIFQQFWMNLYKSQHRYRRIFNTQKQYASNFYSNVFDVSRSGQGIDFKNQFPGVPILLCGAGPSLSKQLDKLPELQDRAFILGAGTGMNILTRRGLRPHFGVGIDPTDATESRFLTSLTYEIPFFYNSHISHKALKSVHAPHLFLYGYDDLGMTQWFAKELNLPLSDFNPKGISSSNYCCEIGRMLGCNPILLIGMDLGYTEEARYAAGASVHPTSDRLQQKKLEKKHPDMQVMGADGKPLMTKWGWILESSYFSAFAQRHPDVNLINATEGGLRILDIPHLKFQEVIENHLQRSYDLLNWLHCAVQNSFTHEVSEQQTLQVLQKWLTSIEHCIDYCEEKEKALELLANQDVHDEIPSIGSQIAEELDQEPAFRYFIRQLNYNYECLAFPEMNKATLFPEKYPPLKRFILELEMNKGRLRFFKSLAQIHQAVLKDCLNGYKPIQQNAIKNKQVPQDALEEFYALKDGIYRIRDAELEIDFEEKFCPQMIPQERYQKGDDSFLTLHDGQALLFYDSGTIKGESFYNAGRLHGPSSFYSPEGTLLARSWFVHGKRIGRTRQYYKTGELYSILRYKKGMLHGKQVYYYPTGQLRTEMSYVEGLLDGDVRLYFPDGRLKREQHFNKGMLQGIERMWNEEGLLILEAEFDKNLPKGTSRTWHANGRLAKEITFYEAPLNFDLRIWDEQGQLIHKQLSLPSNPVEEMLKKSNALKQTIQELNDKLKKYPK